MLGALPALGLLGTSIFDGGGMGAGLGLLGGMAGGLIGSNTPHPRFDNDATAPYVGFNTFGQDYPVGAQGMLQGYLGQPVAGAPGTGFTYGSFAGSSGQAFGQSSSAFGQSSPQGYGFGSNGASYMAGAPTASSYPGGGWYDGRTSVTSGPPYGSLPQYQGAYQNSFGGSLGGNGAFHLGGGSFNQSDPYGLSMAGNYFHQGATSAGISTGPDGFGAVGLFTGYDVGWGSLAAQQAPPPQPSYQAPSYGSYPPSGGGYGYVGAGAFSGFGGSGGGYSGGGGQQGGYPGQGYSGYGSYGGYAPAAPPSYGYAPPTNYGYTPSAVMGGYQGGGYPSGTYGTSYGMFG